MKNNKKNGMDKKRLVDIIFISLIVLVIAVFICVIAKNNCSSNSGTHSSLPKSSSVPESNFIPDPIIPSEPTDW